MPSAKNAKLKAAALVAVAGSAVLLAGAGCAPAQKTALEAGKKNPSAEAEEPREDEDEDEREDGDDAVTADANVNAAVPAAVGNYKDGTYSVTGHYTSPAGPETIKVSITLKGNVITDATVTPQATNKISIKKQNDFAGGYRTQVVGKNIDEVKLMSAIAGSSLTPKGFNEAVEQVKVLAKS